MSAPEEYGKVAGSKPAVIVSGVTETRRELKKFAPDVLKELDKYIKDELSRELIADAASLVPTDPPLSGWGNHKGRTAWDAQKVKRDIKVKQGKRARGAEYSALLRISSETAPGAIFMTLGRKNEPKTPQGRNFILVANNRFGRLPYKFSTRILWDAFQKYGPQRFQEQVLDAYRVAEKRLQARLDAIKAFEGGN